MSIAPRAVFEASARSARRGDDAVLALVLETEGSTYVQAGAAALFAPDGGEPVGWLSGGCLEPAIARHATDAARKGELHWLELDTRDDEDLLSGSSPGCRGRLRLALLPLRLLPGWQDAIDTWVAQPLAMILSLEPDARLRLQLGDAHAPTRWQPPASPCPWNARNGAWELTWAPLSRIAIFGAGPESATLLPLLRALGWKTLLVERRERWRDAAALADVALALAPDEALQHEALHGVRAALVMHHHFEFDRAALEALASGTVDYIGLLGPVRRRDDLFRLLPQAQRESLQPRLRSPVGLDLGGHGAEAIALSIAAQLQQYRHGG